MDDIRRNLCNLDEEERIIAEAVLKQKLATDELERLWNLTSLEEESESK